MFGDAAKGGITERGLSHLSENSDIFHVTGLKKEIS